MSTSVAVSPARVMVTPPLGAPAGTVCVAPAPPPVVEACIPDPCGHDHKHHRGGWMVGAAGQGKLVSWLIFMVLTFVVVLAILYMLQPSFVTDVDATGAVKLNNGKLFSWTLGITIVIWLLLWLLKNSGCFGNKY